MRHSIVLFTVLFGLIVHAATGQQQPVKPDSTASKTALPVYIIKMDGGDKEVRIPPSEKFNLNDVPPDRIFRIDVLKPNGQSTSTGTVIITLKKTPLDELPVWLKARLKPDR